MSGLAPGPSTPFFTIDIRDKFLRGINVGSVPALNEGYQVLTMQEFLDKMYKPTTSLPLDQRTSRPSINSQHTKDTKDRIIRELAKDVCRGIGVEYGRIAVDRAILGGFYDLCVVTTSAIDNDVVQQPSSQGSSQGSSLGSFHNSEVYRLHAEGAEDALGRSQGSPDTEMTDESHSQSLNSSAFGSQQSHQPGFFPLPSIASLLQDQYQHVIQGKMESVMGFIIAQYGECGDHPDEYAINLICTKLDAIAGTAAAAGTAALLFGMYLQSILDRSEQTRRLQTGLLELANGYYNTKGCCLYSKFGFVPDVNLISDSCFSDPTNMPMSLDFSKMYININGSTKSIPEMKQIVCDIVSGIHTGFKLPICNIRGQQQRALVLLKEYERFAYYLQNSRIDEDFLTYICAQKPELRFINSQISRKQQYSAFVYLTLVPELIVLFENPPNPNSPDYIYNKFIRILTMVPYIDYNDEDAIAAALAIESAKLPGQLEHEYLLIDREFDELCFRKTKKDQGLASWESITHTLTFGGRKNKTSKRNKRNKKTAKRNKRNKNTKKRK